MMTFKGRPRPSFFDEAGGGGNLMKLMTPIDNKAMATKAM